MTSTSSRAGMARGTTTFAGVMLAVSGGVQILEGIAALAGDDVYVAGTEYTYELNLTAWGWVHVCLGALGVLIAVGLLTGNTVARITGVVIASLGALTNFVFLPQYPFWSIVAIAFYVLVLWALCTQLEEAGYGAGDARAATTLDRGHPSMNQSR